MVQEEFEFIIKGKINSDSRYLASDLLESVFDGTGVKIEKIKVDNVDNFYPVGFEK